MMNKMSPIHFSSHLLIPKKVVKDTADIQTVSEYDPETGDYKRTPEMVEAKEKEIDSVLKGKMTEEGWQEVEKSEIWPADRFYYFAKPEKAKRYADTAALEDLLDAEIPHVYSPEAWDPRNPETEKELWAAKDYPVETFEAAKKPAQQAKAYRVDAGTPKGVPAESEKE